MSSVFAETPMPPITIFDMWFPSLILSLILAGIIAIGLQLAYKAGQDSMRFNPPV